MSVLFLPDFPNLRADIGADVYTRCGGVLRCSCCKREVALNADAVSDYLRWGWPKCCFATVMTWVTAKELAVENRA